MLGSETSELRGTTYDAKLVYQIFRLKTLEHFLIGYWEQKSDLSNKELGRYIGNTERVNLDHYTPYSLESSNEKLSRFGLSQWIPGLTQ